MSAAEFGSTAWGRAWVRTIESTTAAAPNPLLPGARSLARNHSVSLLVDSGRVRAEVIAAGQTYHVNMDLPQWAETEQKLVDERLSETMTRSKGFLSGDLPDSLEAELRKNRVCVAVTPEEYEVDCDCRSRRRPCVHIFAAIYSLSQLIDERPVLAVELRSATGPSLTDDPAWIKLEGIPAATFYWITSRPHDGEAR